MDEKLPLFILLAARVVVLSVSTGSFTAIGLYCRKRKVGGTVMSIFTAVSVIPTLTFVLAFMIAGHPEMSLLSAVSFGLGLGAAYFGIKMAELVSGLQGKMPKGDRDLKDLSDPAKP